MVNGSPYRIQPDVLEMLEKIPCDKINRNTGKIVKLLAQFCLEHTDEFKKWKKKI